MAESPALDSRSDSGSIRIGGVDPNREAVMGPAICQTLHIKLFICMCVCVHVFMYIIIAFMYVLF